MKYELYKISEQYKKEADQILIRTNLIKFLSHYGKVFIRGSYELYFMIKGDIDIYVVNNGLNKDLAINILNKLIKLNQFRGFLFYDFVSRRKNGFPKGYYIGLKTKIQNERWKIDIWFMRSMDIS